MTGLILCEGDTEQRYFTDMCAHLQFRGKLAVAVVEVYRPRDHSPRGLLQEAKRRIADAAKKELPPPGFIWLVFDKDDHPSTATTFNEAMAWRGSPAIRIAFSAVCFEYFILLHFERTTRPFRKGSEAIRHLRRHLPDYEKSQHLYNDLYSRKYVAYQNCAFVQQQVAADMARGLRPYELAAYTNVHELEYFLEGL
ncbi:MAG: RloB domain-containing protein [Chitinophagia bacterium]|nr:RloB domain-containing protein [Chitinophagia bacterium]